MSAKKPIYRGPPKRRDAGDQHCDLRKAILQERHTGSDIDRYWIPTGFSTDREGQWVVHLSQAFLAPDGYIKMMGKGVTRMVGGNEAVMHYIEVDNTGAIIGAYKPQLKDGTPLWHLPAEMVPAPFPPVPMITSGEDVGSW